MKKILTLIVLALSVYANAQDNVVKVNPLALLGGSDLVSYERVVSDNSSVILGVGFSQFKFGDLKYSSAGAELQYRYYFREVLSGWYAGGQAGYSNGKAAIDTSYSDSFYAQNIEESIKFNSLKIGIKGGHQWVWDSGFSLDLNLGVAHNTFNYSENTDPELFQVSGVFPNLGVALGYSF
jgi:hypothetical protein